VNSTRTAPVLQNIHGCPTGRMGNAAVHFQGRCKPRRGQLGVTSELSITTFMPRSQSDQRPSGLALPATGNTRDLAVARSARKSCSVSTFHESSSVRRADRVLTRRALVEAAEGSYPGIDTNIVATHIGRLRSTGCPAGRVRPDPYRAWRQVCLLHTRCDCEHVSAAV
jgi:hypothetical protein